MRMLTRTCKQTHTHAYEGSGERHLGASSLNSTQMKQMKHVMRECRQD